MADTTPPELAALSFTPNVVDTSAGPQTVTVTVQLVDADSGVANGQLRFRSPSGNQLADTWWDANHRINGDEFKGEYENTLTLPQFSEQGTWSIEYVLLVDQATNTQWINTAQLQGLGFPTTLTQQGKGDTTLPDLVRLAFKPSKIDTANGPQTVKIGLYIRDKPAGLAQAQLRFRSQSGGQYADAVFDSSDLTSGDEFDGRYGDTVTFPQFSEQGNWTIEYVLLQDRANNFGFLQTADLQAKGFGVTLPQTGNGDATPPSLLGLTFTPMTVNAALAPQSVTVHVHVTDKPAGVQNTQIRFRSPSGAQYSDVSFMAQHLVFGDVFDGEYEDVLTIPQHAESGLWTIDYAMIVDAVTNTGYMSAGQLQTAGFPVALTVL
jgi:hypothetical protein